MVKSLYQAATYRRKTSFDALLEHLERNAQAAEGLAIQLRRRIALMQAMFAQAPNGKIHDQFEFALNDIENFDRNVRHSHAVSLIAEFVNSQVTTKQHDS